MATGTVQCPTCGGQFSVDSSMAMQNVRCPHCGESIYLEGFETEPQEARDGGTDGQEIGDDAPQSDMTSSPEVQPHNERSKPSVKMLSLLGKVSVAHCTLASLIAIIAMLTVFCVQLSRLCAQMSNQMSNLNDRLVDVQHLLDSQNDKLDTISRRSNSIVGYKLINYTWEYSALMEMEFRNAIEEGYEPVGYVCQNSLKGGFFLFVKRSK